MASADIALLTPDTRDKALAFSAAAEAAGLGFRVISTVRSCADQAIPSVVIDGRTVKRAPGCRSWHVWGRAFDVELVQKSDDRYQQLGQLGKSMGLTWGGDFATNFDQVHFEYAPGLSISALCPDPADCAGALARGGAEVAHPGASVNPARAPSAAKAAGLGPVGGVAIAAAGAGAGWFLTRWLGGRKW